MKKELSLFLMALVLLSGCTRVNSPEGLQQVDVRLKWLDQAQFAGMYVAKEKGFYENYGLDVNLNAGGVDYPSIPDVLSGNSDFGVAGADDLIVQVSQGASLKSVGVIYKISPVVYFSLKDSGIETPYDFVGNKVGIKSGTGTSYSYISMLKKLDVDREDIDEVEVGYDLTQLYNGDVDVWPGFRINEPHVAELEGYEVNLIKPEEWGIVMYSDVIVATDDFIDANPGIVRSFVKATFEGWQYAITNEEEAIDITMKYVGQEGGRDHQKYMLSKSIPLIHTGDSQIGMMDEAVWQSMLNILVENEIIKESPGLENIYTNKFME